MLGSKKYLLCCALMLAGTEMLLAQKVTVTHPPGSGQTIYSITSGDCRISWVVPGSEDNREVRHYSDCGLPVAEQAPLIGSILHRFIETPIGGAGFHVLSWGRLYPDGARDTTMALRLAGAALRSREWDSMRGQPRGGDMNGWIRRLAEEACIYPELRRVFLESGLDIGVAAVEKVLVARVDRLPFSTTLVQAGARGRDRVPFDCQLWFSVRLSPGTVQPKNQQQDNAAN